MKAPYMICPKILQSWRTLRKSRHFVTPLNHQSWRRRAHTPSYHPRFGLRMCKSGSTRAARPPRKWSSIIHYCSRNAACTNQECKTASYITTAKYPVMVLPDPIIILQSPFLFRNIVHLQKKKPIYGTGRKESSGIRLSKFMYCCCSVQFGIM